MISKISKLLTATLLLAVNFNNSYSMEEAKEEANNDNDNIFGSVLFMGDVSFKNIRDNIQNNKQKLTNYNKELNEYEDTLNENIDKLKQLSMNNDDGKSILGYSIDMDYELIFKKDNRYKNIDDITGKVSKMLEQLTVCNNNIYKNNKEILNIKDNISKVKTEINKQIETFYHYLTANNYNNITIMMHSEKDDIFKAINESLEMNEVKNYIINYNFSKIDIIYTSAKDQFSAGLYGNFFDNDKKKFEDVYNSYIEKGFKQYYDDIDLFNEQINLAKYVIGDNEIKRNMLDTIAKYLNEKKQYIDEKKQKALGESENIFNEIKKNKQNNIEEDNNINKENEINENVINENNINEENINNNDNDNNINEENEINNNEEENNINDNNINNQNNVNVVNNELLQRTVTTLVAGGNDEAQQYETFEEFCNYFFANNGNNIENILTNSNDDQLEYLLTILNINNELQERFIIQYMGQHGVNINQLMNYIYNIQNNNGRVNTILGYIASIQII